MPVGACSCCQAAALARRALGLQLHSCSHRLSPLQPGCVLQVIEADMVLLAMGFLGPEATLAEALGALRCAVPCCALLL